MSISSRSNKRRLLDHIEQQRLHIDRLREQVRYLEDKVQELRAVPRGTENRASELADFCARYCVQNKVRSVPGGVVRQFLAQQRR
jgi:hypothetical protein